MKNDRDNLANILNLFEKDEWKSVRNLNKDLALSSEAAAECLLKNRRVNISIGAIDLEGL